MTFSQVGIANMALQRIGARGTIASLTEDSPNAIKVNICWDMVFQEVLSERDWKFAKTRVQLQQNAQPVRVDLAANSAAAILTAIND